MKFSSEVFDNGGVDVDIHFEKQELLSLFLYLTNRYEKLDQPLQALTKKIEDHVYSSFTVSEIASTQNEEEGGP